MADAFPLLWCFAASAVALALVQRHADISVRPYARERRVAAGRSSRLYSGLAAAFIGLSPASLFLLLSARPWMSLILCLALYAFLATVNQAKIRVLHEPLVLSDALLVKQIFKYPEMYFPFLPVKFMITGAIVLSLSLCLMLFLETALPELRTPEALLALGAGFAFPVIALSLMRLGRLRLPAARLLRLFPVSHDAASDAYLNGTLVSAFMHPVWAGLLERAQATPFHGPKTRSPASRWPEPFETMLAESASLPLADKAHIVLVQAESFCDIRTVFTGERKRALSAFLPHWDALRARNRTLPTPGNAFGAYTMRTEFSILTGLPKEALGPWAFNPYLAAARMPMWSLARFLDAQGYETLCLHPYHKNFFRRDRVMANFGFKNFWDLEDLKTEERFGPHCADTAVGALLRRHMDVSARPVFAFVITMEAHGPWQNDRLTDEEIARCLPELDRSLFNRQTLIYLCHLRHMDELFGMLEPQPENGAPKGRKTLVWAYGDHAPGIDFKQNA